MNFYKRSDKFLIACVLVVTLFIVCGSIAVAYECIP